mmetsp:Transcript_95736/g.310186  ORF Transcript_95736/g.310186 Transcript_95736/m.310186 type:complete len:220 (-) Transcript_95736:974-1633(-)
MIWSRRRFTTWLELMVMTSRQTTSGACWLRWSRDYKQGARGFAASSVGARSGSQSLCLAATWSAWSTLRPRAIGMPVHGPWVARPGRCFRAHFFRRRLRGANAVCWRGYCRLICFSRTTTHVSNISTEVGPRPPRLLVRSRQFPPRFALPGRLGPWLRPWQPWATATLARGVLQRPLPLFWRPGRSTRISSPQSTSRICRRQAEVAWVACGSNPMSRPP